MTTTPTATSDPSLRRNVPIAPSLVAGPMPTAAAVRSGAEDLALPPQRLQEAVRIEHAFAGAAQHGRRNAVEAHPRVARPEIIGLKPGGPGAKAALERDLCAKALARVSGRKPQVGSRRQSDVGPLSRHGQRLADLLQEAIAELRHQDVLARRELLTDAAGGQRG